MKEGVFVVGNAGPLMVLAKLNVLHLLKSLYGYVHIARSVYDETVTEGVRQGFEDALVLHLFLDQMGWHPEEVQAVAVPADLREAHLDRGELDTLALALASEQALVLMDEAAGREMARAHGLPVRGSLGVLTEAFRRQLIDTDQLRLYLADMARRKDIWINHQLVERTLEEALGSFR